MALPRHRDDDVATKAIVPETCFDALASWLTRGRRPAPAAWSAVGLRERALEGATGRGQEVFGR